MRGLFDPDSPVMRKLVLIANLIFLNVLWLICSLPVVTIGAATAAMHAVVFQYLTEKNDEVIRPFFRAFVQNFRQSTLLWLPLGALGVMLIFDGSFLAAGNGAAFPPLWVAFVLLLAAWAVVMTYAFPLIARYSSPLKNILRNSFLLFLMELLPSLFMVALNAFPWMVMVFLPEFFLRTGIFWFLLGGSLVAYLNDRVLLHIFRKHQPDEKKEDEEET